MIAIGDLKDWLGNPDAEGVTELLTTLETMAVELVQDETGRYFGAEETKTEHLVGDGTGRLHLNENPTAITSVERRAQVGDTYVAVTESASDGFELRAPTSQSGRATLLRKGSLAWAAAYEYRVVYEFGYATNAEPEGIRQAVRDLVALKYHTRGREGLKSFAAAGVAWTVKGDSTRLTFDGRDIFSVQGLYRTLMLWRPRGMVLQ